MNAVTKSRSGNGANKLNTADSVRCVFYIVSSGRSGTNSLTLSTDTRDEVRRQSHPRSPSSAIDNGISRQPGHGPEESASL
jgi:hypothetical protein